MGSKLFQRKMRREAEAAMDPSNGIEMKAFGGGGGVAPFIEPRI